MALKKSLRPSEWVGQFMTIPTVLRFQVPHATSPIAALARLSGSSYLIEVDSLAPKETINIGTKPLVMKTPANRTIFVDRPFLTAENVKSLLQEVDHKADKYMVLIYVSGVRYADGTSWTSNQ